MLNTVVNILLQNVSSNLSEMSVGGWVMKLGVPLVLILVLGEFLPKYLGLIYSEPLATRVASSLSFLFRVFSPLLRLITVFAETMSRVIFFFLKPEPPLSASELAGVINACETKGVLSHDEASLIRHSLEFDAKEARELMTPRSAMPALKLSQLNKKNFFSMIRGLSKRAILIIDETPDRPVGACSNKEALLFETEGREAGLASAARQIFFVPEAMPARKLLQEFSERRAVIACVTDEHGSISGYIEAEDLAKTLLGYPQKRSSGLLSMFMDIGKGKKKSIIIPGTTPLTLINDHFKTHLASEYHSATIGGWLEEMLDGIPQEGSSYATNELAFRVLSADDTMIKQLFIESNNEPSVKNQEDK